MAYVTLEKVTDDDIKSSIILQKLYKLKKEAENSATSVKKLAKIAREKEWVN